MHINIIKMKKIIAYSIIGLILLSCGTSSSVTVIKRTVNVGSYINLIDKTDLSKTFIYCCR